MTDFRHLADFAALVLLAFAAVCAAWGNRQLLRRLYLWLYFTRHGWNPASNDGVTAWQLAAICTRKDGAQ